MLPLDASRGALHARKRKRLVAARNVAVAVSDVPIFARPAIYMTMQHEFCFLADL